MLGITGCSTIRMGWLTRAVKGRGEEKRRREGEEEGKCGSCDSARLIGCRQQTRRPPVDARMREIGRLAMAVKQYLHDI